VVVASQSAERSRRAIRTKQNHLHISTVLGDKYFAKWSDGEITNPG
tara:strand:- start:420 stop:557 length:138 start_codon:yes stop_codon:yes gene_type:complete